MFDVELSKAKTKFWIVVKRKVSKEYGGKVCYPEQKFFVKNLFIAQARQLMRLFNANLNAMVNGLIKINEELFIDFSFIDKILTHMGGIQKDKLLEALKIVDVRDSYVNILNNSSRLNQSVPTLG